MKTIDFYTYILDMNFDLIIANPPYGKVGANITKNIIDTVQFGEYINLLPMIDYEKADNKYELWQHVDTSTLVHLDGGFSDAAISPLACKISAKKLNSDDVNMFRINCLKNKLTKKYFMANLSRRDTFKISEQFISQDLTSVIALPLRTKSGNHGGQANLGKTNKSKFYQINNGLKNFVTADECLSICCTTIGFNSIIEKQNVAKLFYSDIGYKFTSWLMSGMNRDAFHLSEHHFWFPKVDWTRSWTVEEILAEYYYTPDEIQNVMDDLKNYKGMDN